MPKIMRSQTNIDWILQISVKNIAILDLLKYTENWFAIYWTESCNEGNGAKTL